MIRRKKKLLFLIINHFKLYSICFFCFIKKKHEIHGKIYWKFDCVGVTSNTKRITKPIFSTITSIYAVYGNDNSIRQSIIIYEKLINQTKTNYLLPFFFINR